MGCGTSRIQPAQKFTVKKGVLGQDEEAAQEFAKMLLDTWTVDSLYTCFVDMDVSATGKVDIDSFYNYFGFTPSSFHDRVFAILDLNGDGFIDFREFVASVCDFGSMDHKSLLRFAFTMFDSDGNGFMTKEELTEMVKDIFGPNWDKNPRIKGMIENSAQADANEDGLLNFEEFTELDRIFPSLLMPAFSMQNRIREKVLGVAHWEKAYRDRAKNGPGYSVFDILSAAAAARRETLRAIESGGMGTKQATRYVPEYVKDGDYVPTVSLNARAKAERRKSLVEADAALKAGDKEKAKKFLEEADRLGQLEDIAAAELAEAESREEKSRRTRMGASEEEEDEEAAAKPRRGSMADTQRRASVRRTSVAASAARRQSGLGVPGGTLGGPAGAAVHGDSQLNAARHRRRSSLANAQDRAMAMAMNS